MNSNETKKHCPECKDDKPLSDFYNMRDKLSRQCKTCYGKMRKEKRAGADNVRGGWLLANGELNVGLIASPLDVSLSAIFKPFHV